NSSQWIEWAFAAWMLGVTIVPMPYPLRVRDRVAFREQIGSLMKASNCKLCVAATGFLDAIPEDQAVDWHVDPTGPGPDVPDGTPDPNAIAVIQFTSGSTAFPKGVMIAHRAAISAVRIFHQAFGDYDPENSRQVSWLPFFHDWGL